MIEYQQDEQAEEELAERLQVFGSRLRRLATEQSQKRAEIEQRWIRDLTQYHGKYDTDTQSRLDNTDGSKIFVNITRNKSNGAEARIGDMLFPTDDRNWAIRPTPVPELEVAKENPELAEQANALIKQAEERCKAMQDQIDDQLTEANYQAKARDMIHDAVVLGTGVIKAPIVVGKQKKKWETDEMGNSMLTIIEDLSPSVEYVDLWNFYPDMSANKTSDCEFFFERHKWTKKQLRDFAKLPNVMQGQLRKVIEAGTSQNNVANDRDSDIRAITGVSTFTDDRRYEIWEYHGAINKQELIDAMDETGEQLLDESEIDALNDEVDAVVFFSNTNVLKVSINPMDSTEKPYSTLCWEKDDASPFGFGIPYLMSSAQAVINSAWRMMIDNGGQAVTDQIIINEELVAPADGKWELGAKKVWKLTDATRSVQEAMASFETRSHQAEYANIIQMARQFADEETNMPLIAQGEQASHVTKTSSGMAMLMNSANIVLRKAVKNWDDDVTDPIITRFYDWNMQFNERQDIKGDYCIDARGSSALLVREKQQENLMIYANISASNQELMMRRDWEGMDREIAKALEVPYESLTKSDEEIQQYQQQLEQSQQQPQDPMIQFKQQEVQLKGQELQLKAQMMQQEIQLKAQSQAQSHELKVAELALRENLTMQQMQTKLQADLLKDKTAREKAAAEISLKNTQANLQAQNLAKGYDTF